MRIISHRANLSGPDRNTENSPDQIDSALHHGYDVEIDVWKVENELFLGHDAPVYPVTWDWLYDRSNFLWVHAKNIQAMQCMKNGFNAFGHDNDAYVVTTGKYVWVYPGKPLIEGCIAVMPERANYTKSELSVCFGICSDFPNRYQ